VRLPLALRAAAIASASIGAFALLASTLAYAVVGSSLRGTLEASLRTDALRVADLYRLGASGSARDALAGPTGGVIVHLYDPFATLLASSSERFTAPLPAAVVAEATAQGRAWRGEIAGLRASVALEPFAFGVVAVIGDVAFVDDALTRLARTLGGASLLLIIASALLGALQARLILQPVRALARAAQQRDADRLDPLPDPGTRDEIARLTAVLNALLARLRDALDAQRTLLAETSHELRTPLTALQGFLHRAARRADPETRSDLADAERLAASMARLLSDLLQLSRGAVVREWRPFLLDPQVDVVAPVVAEFPGVGVDVAGSAWLLGDPDQLRQLLRNLLANAVRWGGDGVRVTLSVDAALVTIAVHDRGPGVPAAARERIFEKFFTTGGGTGIGLAIARQIARAHGGDVTLGDDILGDDSLGDAAQGTTFYVTLPRADVDEDDL
jgi:two-component system, OmpR family, sensor kinase